MSVFDALAYLLDFDRWPPWARRAWLVLLPITLPIWCALWILKVIFVIVFSIPIIFQIISIIIIDKFAGYKLPTLGATTNEKKSTPARTNDRSGG